jgi:hypothetical protein
LRNIRQLSTSSVALQQTNVFGSPLPEVVEKHGWEGAWSQAVTPWDAGKSTPLLHDVLARNILPPGDVLVPGCGAGYDVVTFAKAGRQTVGVDLAPTALQRATQLISSPELKALQPLAKFQRADFFTYAHKPFAVIWEYTFLQALPPSLWPAYAATVKRLLKPGPSGQLVTLMFPVGEHAGGPPFAMKPAQLRALLEAEDFECIEETPVPAALSFKPRAVR